MITVIKLARVSAWFLVVFLFASLLVVSACSKSDNVQAIVLEMSADSTRVSTSLVAMAFDEKNSQVLRCISITESKNEIKATLSKNKSADIKTLIFVNLADLDNSNSPAVKIACVNLQGAEGEYEIGKATYHAIKRSSAMEAVNSYGLPYEDWLTGTLSQDELFPCCQ
jgi:hypothetical protein